MQLSEVQASALMAWAKIQGVCNQQGIPISHTVWSAYTQTPRHPDTHPHTRPNKQQTLFLTHTQNKSPLTQIHVV